MTSSTSETSIRKSKELAAIKRGNDRAFLLQSMSSSQGRGWLWRQLEASGMLALSGDVDPQRMAYEKGQRNMGLLLYSEIMAAAPHLYLKMVAENSPTPLPKDEETDD